MSPSDDLPATDASSRGHDWLAQAADSIVDVVGTVRQKTTGPALTATRGVVYGFLIVIVAVMAVVLLIVGLVRLVHNWVDVWLAYVVLGADRLKPVPILEAAYNDNRGITAAFILNVFHNINRLLQSNFDPSKMRYHSWFNSEWRRVEMYAVANEPQEIRFPNHDSAFRWQKDEPILVEISRKFDPQRLQEQLRMFGLHPLAHFTDANHWYSVLLLKKQT